jgi:hypothetical protein
MCSQLISFKRWGCSGCMHGCSLGLIARFPVSRGKACNCAQVDYIRFTSRLRKDYFWTTKGKLLQPEEAVARLHKDYACRVCRGHKSKTDRCRTMVPMSVQPQCKGELHPLSPKISQGFLSLPGLTQPQFPKVWFSGLPQPQLSQVSLSWNSLS